jgi:N-methylhydantoinase A
MGQSFEVETPLHAGRVDRVAIKRAFFDSYRTRYGYADEQAPLEVMSAVVQAVGLTTKPERAPALKAGRMPAHRSSRKVYLDGEWREIRAAERSQLKAGDVLNGPVVIDQADTTTLVPSGFVVTVDEHLNLIGELVS